MAKARPVTELNATASTGKNARIIARARLEEMYKWDKYADNLYAVHELHNLRIAAKRLRYTLEIFEEVLPKECVSILKEVEQIQEELGTLHDSDVMIALLRLCLGAQDGGTGYEYVLANALHLQAKGRFKIHPEIVSHLLDPKFALSTDERQGLEQLLRNLQYNREKQHTAFRQHWYQLQDRDFQREILSILDA